MDDWCRAARCGLFKKREPSASRHLKKAYEAVFWQSLLRNRAQGAVITTRSLVSIHTDAYRNASHQRRMSHQNAAWTMAEQAREERDLLRTAAILGGVTDADIWTTYVEMTHQWIDKYGSPSGGYDTALRWGIHHRKAEESSGPVP